MATFDRKSDITKMMVSTGSGKDVKDTSQLSGEADRNAGQSATNVIKRHTTAAIPKGTLGGKSRR